MTDFTYGSSDDSFGKIPGTEEDSLESAAGVLRRSSPATGEESLGLRGRSAILQRRTIVDWAQSRGLILDPSDWKDIAETGGAEHDVWHCGSEYWKVTRPDHFGWTVLAGPEGAPIATEASPLEYLNRWQNANRYWGDSVKLRGIAATNQGVQMVISQPFIKGPYPEKIAIENHLLELGFYAVSSLVLGAEINSSFYHPQERIGVFDAARDNFISSYGLPLPVDVITLRANEALHWQLMKLIGD